MYYICLMLNIELKFRDFNKKTKKLYRSGALSFSTERHSFMMYTDKELDDAKDDDIELMQYTGQKDINNKEIFQRDIILVDDTKNIVVWDNNRGGWVVYRCGSTFENDPFRPLRGESFRSSWQRVRESRVTQAVGQSIRP